MQFFSGRLYAMERGLRIPQGERTKTTNSLLISIMNQLEKVYFFYIVFLGCLFFFFLGGDLGIFLLFFWVFRDALFFLRCLMKCVCLVAGKLKGKRLKIGSLDKFWLIVYINIWKLWLLCWRNFVSFFQFQRFPIFVVNTLASPCIKAV